MSREFSRPVRLATQYMAQPSDGFGDALSRVRPRRFELKPGQRISERVEREGIPTRFATSDERLLGEVAVEAAEARRVRERLRSFVEPGEVAA